MSSYLDEIMKQQPLNEIIEGTIRMKAVDDPKILSQSDLSSLIKQREELQEQVDLALKEDRLSRKIKYSRRALFLAGLYGILSETLELNTTTIIAILIYIISFPAAITQERKNLLNLQASKTGDYIESTFKSDLSREIGLRIHNLVSEIVDLSYARTNLSSQNRRERETIITELSKSLNYDLLLLVASPVKQLEDKLS